MDHNATLLEIARLLLSEPDEERTAEILLSRVLESTGAERGFIVLREGDSYEQKFHIRFDRGSLTRGERDFSRTLVRQALEAQHLIYSPNVPDDPRFRSMDSVQWMGDCCVLVAPLRAGGEVYGVVYLEHRKRLDSFDEASRHFLEDFTELAGLFLRRALERQALRERNRVLEQNLSAQHNTAGIVTRAPQMLELLQIVAQVADSEATVLVRGETGTGKELVARALHLDSQRKARPFVTVHCTALPGTILESELFGHVRGAFTGAERERAGRIASAAGGTLFLDEVAEIPLELQAKLLRFLQFGEIQRLGSDRTEKVDVRVVAATHQDLDTMIREGKFRQDLYFRLNVLELEIPPLRKRPQDVPLLLEYFLRRYWKRPGPPARWTLRAQQALEAYTYPGNVRELEHMVERACLLARGPELDLDLLPPAVAGAAPAVPSGALATPEFERYTNAELHEVKAASVSAIEQRFLSGLMQRCEGNISRAARESDIPRSYLQRLLARYGQRGTS